MAKKETGTSEFMDFQTNAVTYEGVEATDQQGNQVPLRTVMLSLLRSCAQLLKDSLSDEEYYLQYGISQKLMANKTQYSPEEVVLMKKLVKCRENGLSSDVAFQLLVLLKDDKLKKILDNLE